MIRFLLTRLAQLFFVLLVHCLVFVAVITRVALCLRFFHNALCLKKMRGGVGQAIRQRLRSGADGLDWWLTLSINVNYLRIAQGIYLRGSPIKTYSIATIPGDGIGKEVIPAGQRVLDALATSTNAFSFDFENFGWGGDYYREYGLMMPDDGLDAIRNKDAILFGSAGDSQIPDHITLWGLRLKICQGFDQYANVRPTRILPGIDGPLKRCGPDDLDWVIVRENSEGEYAGVGGRVHQGHPIEAATDVSLMTRAGVERIMRFAFKLAQSRPRKLLTVITKSNAQRHAMVMWDEIALQISAEFPDVTWDKELVDASTARMINQPATFDTIVATNLHADILSDLAAALAGSLGIAPTGNIDPERRYPSMFEPIHGSAFDIMGTGLANPIGTFWSVVMLLEHLGEPDAAAHVMQAIEQVTATPALHTRDLGGNASTVQVTEAVCNFITTGMPQ